jgi:hypothetical protein
MRLPSGNAAVVDWGEIENPANLATRERRLSRSSQAADYSTVTDFARLRGWSTSVPRTTAV